MREQREKLQELSLLWNGVMNRYRTLSGHIPNKDIRTLADTEIEIIKTIERNQRTVVGDISRSLGVPKSTVTGLIARLERKGYIRRRIHPGDLRTFVLELTDLGKTVSREYEKYEEAFLAKLIEPLSERESKAFLDLLRSIVSQRRVN